MRQANGQRRGTNGRRGRGVRFASRELGLTFADWARYGRRDGGGLRDRLAAWREVVSGQVVIDDEG